MIRTGHSASLAGFPLQSLTRLVPIKALCWIFAVVYGSDRLSLCASYRSNT